MHAKPKFGFAFLVSNFMKEFYEDSERAILRPLRFFVFFHGKIFESRNCFEPGDRREVCRWWAGQSSDGIRRSI